MEKAVRRKGLGRFMVKVLELLMIKANMLKLMATIFKNDKPEVGIGKLQLDYPDQLYAGIIKQLYQDHISFNGSRSTG